MAIDFPNNPSIDDEFTFGFNKWVYIGYAWKRIPA